MRHGPWRLLPSAAVFLSLLLPSDAPTAEGAVPRQEPPGWETVAGQRASVHHRRQEGLAERVLRFLEEQPPLPGIPPDLPRDVSVYLAPDEEAFRELTGGRAPEWGAGVALPDRGVLVLPTYASARTMGGDRGRVLRHEWAHLGLHQHLGDRRIPRWLDEGYAEWAGGWDRTEVWRVRLLLASGRAPPLDSLTLEWPRDAASAQAAYLLSATAVEYLVSESGERGLALFLERWREGGSFEEALRSTYGVTSGQLEEDWRKHVKERYGWLVVLSHSVVLWSALAVLLLFLFGARRRRDRERMARLRAGEVPERPAYWLGEEGAEGEGREGGPGPTEGGPG